MGQSWTKKTGCSEGNVLKASLSPSAQNISPHDDGFYPVHAEGLMISMKVLLPPSPISSGGCICPGTDIQP